MLTLSVAYSEAGDTLNTVDATSAEQPDGVTTGAAVTVLSGIVGSGQDEAGTESGSAPPTTAAGQQTLTDTGLRADQLVVSGLGLLAVGVLLVMAGRPRRDRSTVPGPGA